MSLLSTFHIAAKTAFDVFKSLQKDGTYIVKPVESGWDDSDDPVSVGLKVIPNNLSQKDLQNTRFYSEIQPTDTVIMVLGAEIIKAGIRVRTSDEFTIAYTSYTQLYEIKAFDTDPAEALYLILLREKN